MLFLKVFVFFHDAVQRAHMFCTAVLFEAVAPQSAMDDLDRGSELPELPAEV